MSADSGRWEQLGIFVWLTVCNQIGWVMYSAVPETSAAAFDVSESVVTLLATTYPIVYLPGSMLAARAMNRGGLREAMLESAKLMVCGSLLKCAGGAAASTPGLVLTMLGQASMALGQPHLVNSPAALATVWFPVAERDVAATLGLLGNIVGQAAGEAVSPMVVDAVRARGFSSAVAVAVLSCVVAVPVVVSSLWASLRFRPDASKHPASLRVWWTVLREDKDFRLIWVAFCVGISLFNTLLALAAQWLKPCGYAAATVGLMTATFVLVGVPAAALVGVLLDSTRAYRPVLKTLALFDLAATLALCLAAARRHAPSLFAAWAALGAAMIASSAAVMETAVECTHPHPPEVATGCLFCGGNVLSIGTTYAFQALLASQHGACRPLAALFSSHGRAPVATFIATAIALCAAFLVAYRGPYRRYEAERRSVDRDDDAQLATARLDHALLAAPE